MKKDLTGQRFGKLFVREVHSRSRNGHIRWQCDCDCGREHAVLSTHLLSNKITHCGCVNYRGPSNKLWRGHGEISGHVWDSIKKQGQKSKSRAKLDFSITIEYCWDLFLEQNRKCALSGVDIYFPNTTTKTNSRTASLDRIDFSMGYVEGNVQWVHKDVNLMKNRLSEKYFIAMCDKIAAHSRKEN